ncbi:efflux RND transporter periplasmic adaptor subunit [Novispirillum sp. DQ9]|uniref:efflux RND transporter periplasmic adaptor subunit n=1 Tax=Novispirillum sp. DQ9 TaxID=3398612 RepID=UPI003C7DAD3E
MTPLTKRLLLWTVPLLAVAAALTVAFQPQPIPVDMVAAARGPLEVRVAAEGRTRVRDVYRVSAPVSGEVQRLPVKVGDPVTAEVTLLAVISPAAPQFLDQRRVAEAQAAFAAAQAAETEAGAAVRRAEAATTYAQAELRRVTALATDGTAPRRALEQARSQADGAAAALDSARALLDVRRHELEAARARLMQPAERRAAGTCCVEVHAPVDGRVLAVLQESQAVVAAGAPLVEVGDPAALEVVADVLSADAVRIAPGAEARLDDWGGAPLAATVRTVEPTAFTKVSALGIEEQRVNIVLDLTDPPPAALGHGFRVMARILTWRADDALILPLGALFRTPGGWAVFRVEDGVARERAVDVERLAETQAAISGGLSAGDRVILHPSDRVRDGVAVIAR